METKRKDYVSIRVDVDTKVWFDRRAGERDLKDGQFLRHLLAQDERMGAATIRGQEGELLVSYNAVVHAPVCFRGTVSRWAPTEPPSEEEEPPEPTNNT